MPGLSQLNKFNKDMLTLGDEVKVRASRGEKPVTVSVPSNITIDNDSDDFINGMPSANDGEKTLVEKPAEPVASVADFDLSSFLDPVVDDVSDEDLSAFDEPVTIEELPAATEIPPEVPIEDASLESLLDLDSNPIFSGEAADDSDSVDGFDATESASKDISSSDSLKSDALESSDSDEQVIDIGGADGDFVMPDLDNILTDDITSAMAGLDDSKSDESVTDDSASNTTDDFLAGFPDINDIGDEIAPTNNIDSISDINVLPEFRDEDPSESTVVEQDANDNSDQTVAQDDTDLSGLGLDGLDGLDTLGDLNFDQSFESDFSEEAQKAMGEFASDSDPLGGMPLGDIESIDSNAADTVVADASSETSEPESSSSDDINDLLGGMSFDDFPSDGSSSDDASSDDASSDDVSSIDALFGDVSADAGSSTADASSDADDVAEVFDTTGLDDDIDFSGDGDADSIGDGGFDEFVIEGFSDTVETANFEKKEEPRAPVYSDDVEEEEQAKKPKNTFTDAEYKRFLENLEYYPLNVRIAVEELVVSNDFKEDAVFDILEKVLNKVPARQLAKVLGDLTDKTLQVPRDYERRTSEEYEAYKQSMEYQLKNRIIPFALLSTAAAILVLCIWILSNAFIYKPLRANHFYKQGYELIEAQQYPQSEDKFNKALTYQSVKNWFYKYARSYRDHHQYERARVMYNQILLRFNHDKQAGLEWAAMEANDLFNYEESERILKREVLDYHINDSNAILQLGDMYLDWATDKDPTKFDAAKDQYDLALALYGEDKKALPTYLSRQMRYYIRTDNLAQVIRYKTQYFPNNKNLEPDDLTEVAGYLLDKRYGKLSPSEESWRVGIEGLRDLLEAAVKASPNNPVALYNMGRYFVKTNNGTKGTMFFKSAIQVFKDMRYRNRRDTYKFIDTYRLLGEEYVNEKEYILAQGAYGDGIDLFEKENASSGFEGTELVGQLYSDMGDINYFIHGDMDVALANYKKSVENKNDTSSVRYRIGYIQYQSKNYPEALGSFIRSSEADPSDSHALLALANTLSLRDDNYAAQGYYDKLIRMLEKQKLRYGIMLPQVREDQNDLVSTYMKACNNLGVTLSRIADITGNSKYNAQAIVQLQESLRAWDALTRNQTTMVRLPGSNLAEQNIKYITEPYAEFDPEIYTEIPKIKNNEEGL